MTLTEFNKRAQQVVEANGFDPSKYTSAEVRCVHSGERTYMVFQVAYCNVIATVSGDSETPELALEKFDAMLKLRRLNESRSEFNGDIELDVVAETEVANG